MNKKILFLISAIIFIIILAYVARKPLSGVSTDFFSPVSGRLAAAAGKIKSELSFIVRISDLHRENEDLYKKLANLNVDRSKILELGYENELLKKELGFVSQDSQSQLIPARVIGRDPASFLDHIIIDKGEADGLEAGLPAICSGILIGQVKEVFEHTATITLVTSKDSLILAMLQDSREKGILRGGISGLTLENIAQDVNIAPGEYIVTSGLDGELPQGLLIGKAGMIQSSTSDLFKNVSVEMIFDLSKLELVFIKK